MGRVRTVQPRSARARILPLLVIVVLAGSLPANAYPRPGETRRVSVGPDGSEADLGSTSAVLSGDGRFVAFDSEATNLVPGDTNETSDVFVHDRATGSTTRVSVSSEAAQGNGPAGGPSITPDGRYVSFSSQADNLVPGDRNQVSDVFVHDRITGRTVRASVAGAATDANALSSSGSQALSSDGRFVAFMSLASNLVAGDTNLRYDVFVRDLERGTTERVSLSDDGSQANDHATAALISGDARFVAFRSPGANLVASDTNGDFDVFLRDRLLGRTERVSVGTGGAEANHRSQPQAMTPDGRFVLFSSYAENLVPGDTNQLIDLFVRDRQRAATERVSVGTYGTEGVGAAAFQRATLSADGRVIAFRSLAPNLVGGDTNGAMDVFVRDRSMGSTTRVPSVAGEETNFASNGPLDLSDDGRFLAFTSASSDHVAADTNGSVDVFVRDLGPDAGVGRIQATRIGGAVSVSGWATFSGTEITSVSDPGDDGGAMAQALGADIAGASLIYRPEEEDLLFRMRLSSMPGTSRKLCPGQPSPDFCIYPHSGAGVPTVRYAAAFELWRDDPIQSECVSLEATRPSVDAAGLPVLPSFTAGRCGAGERLAVPGSFATTGPDVWISVPLSFLRLPVGPGLRIEVFLVSTFAGVQGVSLSGSLDLAYNHEHRSVPVPGVSLGIAPAGRPQDEVEFGPPAELVSGAVSGSLSSASLAPGPYDVWARGCLGSSCGASAARISV